MKKYSLSLAKVYFFIWSSYRDSHRAGTLCWLTPSGSHQRLQDVKKLTGQQGYNPKVICMRHPPCTFLVMPQMALQFEPHALKHSKANSCLTPALFLSLKLTVSTLCAFQDRTEKQDLKVGIIFSRANASIQSRFCDHLDYYKISSLL